MSPVAQSGHAPSKRDVAIFDRYTSTGLDVNVKIQILTAWPMLMYPWTLIRHISQVVASSELMQATAFTTRLDFITDAENLQLASHNDLEEIELIIC